MCGMWRLERSSGAGFPTPRYAREGLPADERHNAPPAMGVPDGGPTEVHRDAGLDATVAVRVQAHGASRCLETVENTTPACTCGPLNDTMAHFGRCPLGPWSPPRCSWLSARSWVTRTQGNLSTRWSKAESRPAGSERILGGTFRWADTSGSLGTSGSWTRPSPRGVVRRFGSGIRRMCQPLDNWLDQS